MIQKRQNHLLHVSINATNMVDGMVTRVCGGACHYCCLQHQGQDAAYGGVCQLYISRSNSMLRLLVPVQLVSTTCRPTVHIIPQHFVQKFMSSPHNQSQKFIASPLILTLFHVIPFHLYPMIVPAYHLIPMVMSAHNKQCMMLLFVG